jgi:spermidine synthase
MKEDGQEDSSLGEENRSRGYIYLTVFVAGMTTLAVEFTTSRMLQTVYGTSNIVWANVIGLVLLFLTLGYFLGGRLADRYPRSNVFYWLVTIAGVCSVVSLLVASLILRSAASALASINAGALISSLVGVIFTLALPITLLGCVSPFAIRLAMRDIHEAGRLSGRIYAFSTLGSLLGTYLPVLLIIPLAGSRIAAILFGSALFIVGIIGLWRTKSQGRWAALFLGLLVVPIAFFLNKGSLKDDPDQIYETESAYNYIQVIRQGDCNYLLLNEGQAYHSFYCDDGHVPQISVWSIMLAAPYFEEVAFSGPVRNMAVIGLAAGTIPKQFTQVFGPIPIDGIELDPDIVQAGREYFALDEPNINVIVGDGRYELNQLKEQYDVITLDAYKVPYIPWHLTTQQFFGEVKDHLTDRGVLAINVGRVPNDRRLVEAVTSTLLKEFSTVHTIDVPGSLNTILVATVRPTSSQNLYANLAFLGAEQDPLLVRALQTAAENIVTTIASEVVFTDEKAPVETMIDSIVIRYLLEEGPGALPGLGG